MDIYILVKNIDYAIIVLETTQLNLRVEEGTPTKSLSKVQTKTEA